MGIYLTMKTIIWNSEKNEWLLRNRGVCFEDILFYLEQGGLLDDVTHPNPEQYEHQRMLVVDIENYAYLVPYVEKEAEIFLKTIFPSRKATKKYLKDKK